jgi:hypothetical protein
MLQMAAEIVPMEQIQIEKIKNFFFFTDDFLKTQPDKVKENFEKKINSMLDTCFDHEIKGIKRNIFNKTYPDRILVTNSLNEDVSIVAQLDPKQKGAIYMLSNVCKESVGEKGLGSQLMDAVITWANAKNKPIKLNVLLKNPDISLVISLYSKYGFVYQTLIDEMLIFLYTPNVPFVRRTPNEIYKEIITDPLIRPEIKLKIQIIIKKDLKNNASKGKKIRKSKRIIKSKRTRNSIW